MTTKNFWSRVFSDWPAKVLSLAVALLLFFFYHLSRLETRVLSVPLDVVANEEFVPSSQYPRSVKLTLRGESASLFQLQEEDFRASLDLSAAHGPGLAKANVVLEKRGAAVDMDPLEVTTDPATVSVTMDRKTSRIVPVTPSFRGYLDPGYELASFDLAPGEVAIEGPAGVVDKVSDVTTEPIELSGRHGDFAVKAKLQRSSPLLAIPGTDSAEFRAVVAKTVALKSFTQVPVAVSGLPDYLSLAEPLPAIHLRVKAQGVDLKDFAPAPDALVVDLSQARKAGSYTVPVQATLPEGLSVDELQPASLTVRVVQRQGGGE